MTRSARLLDLIQALRRRRRPVAAGTLAEELGVSPRTVYRDIATLVSQGAPIEGEAGLGYVLRPGYLLPPLMFDDDELDALILGLRLVVERTDEALGLAADNALAKIVAVLPAEKEDAAATSGLLAGPIKADAPEFLASIRQAIRGERKLRLSYTDRRGTATERVVWPIAVGFLETADVLAAWCELRSDFRHFRLDRIVRAETLGARIPRHRRVLLAEWRLLHEIDG
jgi:predicted DNA-binding transcriptional regulator YafY